MTATRYAIALGSNRGAPRAAIDRALALLEARDCRILARSRTISTRPLGPGTRDYANAAAIVATRLDPPAMLALCKAIEAAMGRRAGRRWGDRPIDLDIILWSEGGFAGAGLVIPHPAFRARPFVLRPLDEIAPGWRDPVTGLAVRQLAARLARRRAVDRPRARS